MERLGELRGESDNCHGNVNGLNAAQPTVRSGPVSSRFVQSCPVRFGPVPSGPVRSGPARPTILPRARLAGGAGGLREQGGARGGPGARAVGGARRGARGHALWVEADESARLSDDETDDDDLPRSSAFTTRSLARALAQVHDRNGRLGLVDPSLFHAPELFGSGAGAREGSNRPLPLLTH